LPASSVPFFSSSDAIHAPPLPTLPDWLPVRHYGGYHKAKMAQSDHHPMIISDRGNWSIECACGGI